MARLDRADLGTGPDPQSLRRAAPALPVVVLAENVAEKIARLNRRSPARDAYDLVWVAGTPGVDLDRPLIRRLAVLKAWVDLHGLATSHATWAAPLPGAQPFDVDRWLVLGRHGTSTTRRSVC